MVCLHYSGNPVRNANQTQTISPSCKTNAKQSDVTQIKRKPFPLRAKQTQDKVV
jgi:hypothetical protein